MPVRRLVSRTLIVVLLLLGVLASPAAMTPAAAQDTSAVAVNTKDGASVFRLAFNIRRVAGSVVDETNVAVAYASCTDCQTVAIAFQIVLATGDVDTVTPQNYAVAVNEECAECTTVAAAYQFAVGTDGPVHFTSDGSKALADIRRRLRDLGDADLEPDALLAELDLIADEVRRILDEELVSAGPPKRRDEVDTQRSEGRDEPTEGAATESPPAPSESEAEPDATASPSPAASQPAVTPEAGATDAPSEGGEVDDVRSPAPARTADAEQSSEAPDQ